MGIVYLNGAFCPLEEARISPMDRGFLFADGVYEVIPIYQGRLFRFEHHIERLQNSLSAIKIPNPHTLKEWRTIFTQLISAYDHDHLSLYLQITRGPAQKRDHAFPHTINPTVFAYCSPLPVKIRDVHCESGCKAILYEDIRWQRCDIKSTNLLGNILMRQAAIDQGAVEAIITKDGYAIEGAASNLFVCMDGTIITPPKTHHILGGITRDLVIELAIRHQLPVEEQTIQVSQLMEADEIWITSSTKEIVPIVELEGQAVGDGKPGPIWCKMTAHYQAYIEALTGQKDQ